MTIARLRIALRLVLRAGAVALCAGAVVLYAGAVALGVAVVANAQPKQEVGLYVSGALNLHNASFTRLGDVRSCCPEFTNTSGLGWSAGAFYTYPLNDLWRLQARLTYADRSATLEDTETSFVADLRDSAKVVEALFVHEVHASVTDIGLEPLLLFRPFGRLDIMIGGRIAIPIATTFRQTETLTEPADYGSYLGGNRVYVDTSADIPNVVSPQLSIATGLRYVIPLGARGATFLAPEIQYTIPLTQISDGTTWSVAHLRFGISLGFVSPPPMPVVPVAPEIPPPQPTIPVVTASVVAKGVTADGRELDNVTIHVEEIAASEIVPVLPHVYFDSASANWIAPQLASRTMFDSNPEGMDLETAIHSIPWLIADRLRKNPKARARLIGTTSEYASDRGLTLARARAQSVKDAFVQRGVGEDALSIEARRSPAKPTIATDTTQASLAAAENRRVEIEVLDPSLVAPYTLRSIERTVDPPTMRAYVTVENVESIGNWSVSVKQGEKSLARFNGAGNLPRYVEWNLVDSGVPETETPIIVQLSIPETLPSLVEDTVSVSQLTIRKKRIERIAGREIERFNLLLFEFNDARVSTVNAKLLDSVRKHITPLTEVTVYGLTDELGAEDYNRDLSRRRAAEVAALLNVPQTRIIGSGEDSPKYWSKTPVSRGYNRTVVIELVTPAP